MTKRKLFAGLLALSMLAPTIPAQIASAGTLPSSDYLYYEDFEEAYDTKFDSPTVAADKQRWSNEVQRSGSNHYMAYIVDTSKAHNGNSSTPMNVRFQIELEDDTWYEFGYRFDMNDCTPYFNSCWGLKLMGNYGVNKVLANGSNSNNSTTTNIGSMYNENGVVSNVALNFANIDGFVTVKYQFSLTANENTTDKIKYGEAVITYTWKDTDGKSHEEVRYIHAFTAPNASHQLYHIYDWGISEWSGSSPTNNSSFRIDDVYLKTIPTYEVTFDYAGGTDADGKSTVTKASDLEGNIKLPTVTRDGYQFNGWTTESGADFDGSGVDADMTITANWLKLYTVTYNTGDNEVTVEDGIAVEGTGTVEIPDDPRRVGYEFDGWYLDDGTFEEEFTGEGIAGDLDVYAKWLEAHKITFIAPDAEEDIDDEYAVTTLKKLPVAVRTGYRFDGWFLDDGTFEEEFTTETEISGDTEVYAKWSRKHVVSFESRGGGDFDVMYILDETMDLETLPVPSKKGFGFEYWCTDSDATVAFDGTVTEDITLYARYNNLILKEDFEETDGIDYMKQFSANGWEALVKLGAGVVEDPDDPTNKCFRMPIGGSMILSFPDGGSGLYEISYRVRQNSTRYVFSMAQPRTGSTGWSDIKVWDYQIIGFLNEQKRIDVWTTTGAKGWVNVTVWYDTVNGLASCYADWTTAYGKAGNGQFENISVNKVGSYIDGILIGNTNGADVSDVYLDDYYIRKIEQPTISSMTPSAGDKDVELNPTITLNFDRLMDRTTITNANVYLTDTEGNTITSDVLSENINGKTVTTIKPKTTLAKDTKYIINVTMDVRDANNYYMDRVYAEEFTTVPNAFQVETKIMTEDGEAEINKLVSEGGTKVQAILNLRNYAGGDVEDYFVSAALVDTTTGMQLDYQAVTGTLAKGEQEDVLKAVLSIPETVSDNHQIQFLIWDKASIEDGLNSNWDIIVFK